MLKKLIYVSLFALVVLAAPGGAIVHHCTYDPEILAPGVHNRDEQDPDRDCGNLYGADPNEINLAGSCQHESAFYYTRIDCFDDGGTFAAERCEMEGKIDCPGGDRVYSMRCSGASPAGTWATAGRTEANCNGEMVCTCDSPTSASCG